MRTYGLLPRNSICTSPLRYVIVSIIISSNSLARNSQLTPFVPPRLKSLASESHVKHELLSDRAPLTLQRSSSGKAPRTAEAEMVVLSLSFAAVLDLGHSAARACTKKGIQ